jgi:hypothetical protein
MMVLVEKFDTIFKADLNKMNALNQSLDFEGMPNLGMAKEKPRTNSSSREEKVSPTQPTMAGLLLEDQSNM